MDNMNNAGGVRVEQKSSALLLVLGYFSAVISLVRYPFIFGVIGIVMGILTSKNGSRAGVPLILTSIILMAVGMIFGGVFFNNLRHFLGI
jgi:hypothetical protein